MSLRLTVLLTALALVASAAAIAAEYQTTPAFHVPDWLYASIAAGIVQGLITFGAIKIKFDWLFQRLTAIEIEVKESVTSAREEIRDVHKRIDRVVERRRATDEPIG